MITYREAIDPDRSDIARVHVRSWQVGYRGLIPDEYLDQLRPEDRAARYTFGAEESTGPQWIVGVDEAAVVGFIQFGRSRDQDALEHGEVFALYVDPQYWGRGVGRALLDRAQHSLYHRGFRAANLWVLADNVRTMRFYERNGWSPDGLRHSEEVWGLVVESVRYQRELGDVTTLQ
ncbi:MAG: GNAT family N-acetyltransferase [Acidimicrobiaceae bacterium]|nr:GNAT family N-acetyltransferase [Acidimicrobiaceae bacterium]